MYSLKVQGTTNVPLVFPFKKTNDIDRVSRIQEAADTFEISSNAQLYCKVRNAIKGLPEVRSEKVEEFKQKIKEGYDIPAEDLADKMLSGYKAFKKQA